MKPQKSIEKLFAMRRRRRERQRPRGVVVVLTGFCLVAVFAFVALSVDTSRIALTETRMQNAVDAAALAAVEEITAAVYAAGSESGAPVINSSSEVIQAAREMAANVAEANGIFVGEDVDVQFGKRGYDPNTGTWPIVWGSTPYNCIKVTARKTNADVTADDGQLPLAFGWAVGRSQVPLQKSATAFVEARDVVVVIDVSASMNDDSSLDSTLTLAEVEDLLDGIWDSLLVANPRWPSTTTSKFPSTGFGSIDSYEGTYISSTDTSTIRNTLGLNQNVDGSRKYPYPQAGRNSDGTPKNKPGNSTSDSLWNGYIDYVKNLSGPYKKKYGYRTLGSYFQQHRYDTSKSEDLWRTPHYPYHAVKGGNTLFLEFLDDLDFGDEVGLVAYGEWAVQQLTHNDGEVSIDISSNPITSDYDTINTMQLRHQAGEYNGWTAMGDGLKKARELLLGPDGTTNQGHCRVGAQPTILVMTDGMSNQKPSGWSLPAGFKWSDWTDYDGDGVANYSTTDNNKRYAFVEATKAIKKGVVIHTLGVGNDADRNLMKAIAFASGGVFINVPGEGVEYMEAGLLQAFAQIAGKVPPAKLVYEQ